MTVSFLAVSALVLGPTVTAGTVSSEFAVEGKKTASQLEAENSRLTVRVISIRGRVLARPDGEGVSGVKVQLPSDWDRRYRPVVVTDAQGFFVFEDVDPGPYSVSLAEQPVGTWTAGAGTMVYVAEDPNGTRADKTRLTSTGAQGLYTLAEVGTGPGQYRASKKQAANAREVMVITNHNQQRQRVELYRGLPQSVSGRVVDTATGEPVPDAGIAFDKRRGRLKSDAMGRYRIYIHPCRLYLWTDGTKDRYYPRPGRTVEVKPDEHLTGVDLHVQNAPAVAGQVVAAGGSGAGEGIDVWLIFAWRDKEMRKGRIPGGRIYDRDTIQQFKTDRSGRFTGYLRRPEHWNNLSRFDVSITACALSSDGSQGGFVRTGIMEPDVVSVEPLRILLHKTGTAELSLKGPDGVGVSDANVIGRQYHGGTPLQPSVLIEQIGNGRYLAKGLIPGLGFTPFVQAGGYRHKPTHTEHITVEAGENTIGPEIKLQWNGAKEVPELLKYIRAFDEGIPYNLGRIGPDARDAVPALVDILRRPTEETTFFRAARSLSKTSVPSKATDALVRYFEPTNDTVLFRTAEALGKIGVSSQPVKAALIDLVETKWHTAANAAARSLGQLRVKEALEPIETALKEGRVEGRFALPALWQIKKAAASD